MPGLARTSPSKAAAAAVVRHFIPFAVSVLLAVTVLSATKTSAMSTVHNKVSGTSFDTAGPDTDGRAALKQALMDGTSLDASERICTVDENNVPTANGNKRNEMRLKNLWHRATYIIVRHEDESVMPDDSTDAEKEEYLLIQKRSKIKDYCPGKLDPAPGGVVGFGESYDLNVERELLEEMGIDVASPGSGNTVKRLFTFPYRDDRVRCWGGLYEAVYTGPFDGLKIQEEEVEEVMKVSIGEIQRMAEDRADEWMPDGLHALRLYLQYQKDLKVKRRSLKGYSSGDLDAYKMRPKPQAIFFDCDDCLYFDDWKIANRLTAKIEEWYVKRGLENGQAYELYKKYGTALKGLLAEGYIEHCEKGIDAYLKDVHDLPIDSLISEDKELRTMIQSIDPTIPKYIFTASVSDHARRCIKALGIDDLFVDIIDVKACNLATKHSKEAFQAAMRVANISDPESCILLDDSVKNIEAAREAGWRAVLVGLKGRDCGTRISSEHAEHEIDLIHDFPKVYPELFQV